MTTSTPSREQTWLLNGQAQTLTSNGGGMAFVRRQPA
jgi:hypothetical protein